MTSAPSSIKKGSVLSLFWWSVRKTLPITIMVSVLYFLVQPVVMMLTEHKNRRIPIVSVYETTLIIAAIISWVFVVVVASTMFSYLQNKQSVDFFHSLPLTRKGLFLSRYFAGLFSVSVPIILSFLFILIFSFVFGFNFGDHNVQKLDYTLMLMRISKDLGLFLLLQTAFYTMTVFVFINTGTMLDSMISLLALNGIFPASIGLINIFLVSRLPGFSTMISEKFYFMFSPFARMVTIPFIDNMEPVFWWTFFIILFFASAILQYTRRKSEFTGNAYTFALLKILFKVLIPFCAGLGLAFTFVSILDDKAVFIIGFLAGALLSYVLTESIFSRGFRTLIKSGGALLLAVALFFGFYFSTETGFFGYSTRLPERSQIESVRLLGASSALGWFGDYNFPGGVLLEESESIDLVYDFHKAMVEEVRSGRAAEASDGFNFTDIYTGSSIKYVLNLRDGKKVKRYFTSEKYSSKVSGLFELKEYKFKTLPVNYPGARDSEWRELQIMPAFSAFNVSLTFTLTKDQSIEFAKAMRDTYRYDTTHNKGVPLGSYKIYNEKSKTSSEDLYVYDEINPITEFFKKYGYYENFTYVPPEDMYAVISKDTEIKSYILKDASPYQLFNYKTALLYDRDLIETLKSKANFEISNAYQENAEGIYVAVGRKNNPSDLSFIFFVPKSEVPPEIYNLEYLNQSYPDTQRAID